MNQKLFIQDDLSHVHEVPSMKPTGGMLGFFFIDGSNLYHNLKASKINPKDVNIKKLIEILAFKLNVKNYKIIYFNSIPSILDGEEKYFKHVTFLEKLKDKGIEVHTRKLQRLSTKEKLRIANNEIKTLGLCNKCSPIVESHYKDHLGDFTVKEKGVDMLIAIEMIRHGIILKDCSRIILVSGDADFIPCMDLLKMQGVNIMSACTAKGYSYELRDKHKWFIIDKDDIKKAI